MATSIKNPGIRDKRKDTLVDGIPDLSLSGLKGKPEFLNKDKTLIAFNDRITGQDVINSLKPCIKAKFWAKKSRILIICGFHTSHTGEMGASYSAFHGLISKHLDDLEQELITEIKDMEYEFESLLLSTVPYKDVDGNMKYELDRLGHRNLRSKFLSVLESESPHVLVFGTCFSKKSEVNDYISACGLYPVLFLSSDKGNVTQGRCFALDPQQRKILKKTQKSLDEGRPQHVFLWGSNGTGKTLLLVEILRMYLAHFKLKGMNTKVLVVVYHLAAGAESKLLDDLKNKYFGHMDPNTSNIQIQTLKQACTGKIMYVRGFELWLYY